MTMQQWGALGGPGRGQGDRVIYYRKPNGWITYGDSVSGTKLRDFVARGFEPLMQYGYINTQGRDNRRFGTANQEREAGMTEGKYIWEQILSHPDGPAEFPLEQVIAMRWYRPENCPVEDAYFPQLAGKKIREYNCPEQCGRAPFVDIEGAGGMSGLRTHLRIMHGWDQANLLAYGERVGIDFTHPDVVEAPVHDFEADAGPVLTCEECGKEFSGGAAKARLTRHRKDHAKVEIEIT